MQSDHGTVAHDKGIVVYECDAAGNRIVLLDARDNPFDSPLPNVRRWLHEMGLDGWEQLATLSRREGVLWVDLKNPDDSPEGFCGNALRCLSLIDDLPAGRRIVVRTTAGEFQVLPGGGIAIPDSRVSVTCLGGDALVDVGTPHRVRCVSSWLGIEVLARMWSTGHAPVNATFIQCDRPGRFMCRTFERGVGETGSCGSGALATVIAHSVLLNVPYVAVNDVQFFSGNTVRVVRAPEEPTWQVWGPYRLLRRVNFPVGVRSVAGP
jgi:diaminopimelate epimerase